MTSIKVLILILATAIVSCKSNKNDELTFILDDGLLIENPTIISANQDGNLEKYVGYVLIHENKIIYCGDKKPIVSSNINTIDAKGKYLVPGLIDSHTHLANMAGFTWRHEKQYPKLTNDYYKQLPKNYLQYGYTTLIDVNPYFPIIKKIRQSPIRPDIITCGQQVQVMDDFMMEMEELSITDRLSSGFLYDKYNNNLNLPDSINLQNHSPKAIINNIKREQQGICVKTLYEDETSGFPLFWKQPTVNLMKDLVSEAHNEGLPVLLHSTSYEAQKFGLESGVDIFAHSLWNWYQEPKDFLNTTFESYHKELLTEISKKRKGYQLTFRAIHGEVDLLKDNFFNDPALKKVYTEEHLNWLNSKEGKWGRDKILNRGKLIERINPELYQTLRSNFDSDELMFKGIQDVLKFRMNTVAKFLSDNNANLLFATDGVAMNMATNPPGYNGFLEMQHWFNAGVSLENIFKAATYNNAKAFHLDNDYGTIEKDKIANLLVLDQNPLVEISAYDSIKLVIVHGKIHKRKDLIVTK